MQEKPGTDAPTQTIASFAHVFALVSGTIAILLAVAGIWAGLTIDTVLRSAGPELWTAAGITAVAGAVLFMPWGSAVARSLGLAAAGFAYHLVLDMWWVPWTQNLSTLLAAGRQHLVWDQAPGLPLINLAGVLLILAAVFSWPVSPPAPRRTDGGRVRPAAR